MKKYEGKNLEDLLKSVAKEKDCEVEELTYYVVEEKAGMFGLGKQIIAEIYSLEDVREFIEAYLTKFFDGLQLDVDITVNRNNDSFKVMLNAENNAMLIGKNGSTLQALNIVTRAAANAEFKRRFYVMIDINNYKSERYDKIKHMAKRVAQTVQKTRVAAKLDPMPNDERRIIHQYLNEMKNIRTVSEGEGNYRYLRIIYDENKEANYSKEEE